MNQYLEWTHTNVAPFLDGAMLLGILVAWVQTVVSVSRIKALIGNGINHRLENHSKRFDQGEVKFEKIETAVDRLERFAAILTDHKLRSEITLNDQAKRIEKIERVCASQHGTGTR